MDTHTNVCTYILYSLKKIIYYNSSLNNNLNISIIYKNIVLINIIHIDITKKFNK